MRYGTDDRFWVVTDPTPDSELADICFEASLRDLERQFRGGLTCKEQPTLFTDRREAEVEAFGRLVAMRAARAIARGGAGDALQRADRVEILDGDGTVLFQAELGEIRA
ncbi:MAG: hypothetical protein IT345_08680 [Trueperaceae bacterium]|nr:hypothetical protein [Trueperaceae bacterium]